MKKNLLYTIFISLLLFSCQSAKDVLTIQKKSSQADEFLVEKKNPLVLPPEFSQLPLPDSEIRNDKDTGNFNIPKILGKITNTETSQKKENKNYSIEDSVLKKIK